MISSYLSKFSASKISKVHLESLRLELSDLRKNSNIVSFCPTNTAHHWLGIKQAAKSLFSECLVELPQQYSNSLLTIEHLSSLGETIGELNFQKIIFNGFPPYFEQIIRAIARINSSSKQFLLFAGPASEYTNPTQRNNIQLAAELAKQKLLYKVGFNKKGLADAFSKIYRVYAGEYMVKTTEAPASSPKSKSSSDVSIGVFGSDSFNKNLHTQVIAALLVENSKVHVVKKSDFTYLQTNRIIGQEGILSHDKFLERLRMMDVNAYLSFSESWGLVVTESLAQGTPCITTVNSGIFDYDAFLQEQLVVRDYDNVIAIKKQFEIVLENYASISQKGIEYVAVLNKVADDKLKTFLEE